MKLINSLSTVLWVSVVSMSMLLPSRDVSAAWGWDSSTAEEEVDEVKINKAVKKVNDATGSASAKATTVSAAEVSSEIPVSFENHSSMNLHINWVNRDTQEEKRVLDTALIPSGKAEIKSHPGHTFVAFNEERTVRLVYFVDEEEVLENNGKMTFIITEKDISPDREVMAKFINTSSKTVQINFINTDTKEEKMVAFDVEPFVGEFDADADDTKAQQGVEIIQSHPGHVFAIFDEERSFRKLLTVDHGHIHGDTALFKITDFDTDSSACKAYFVNDFTGTKESVVRVTWVNPDTDEETTVVDKLPAGHQSSGILTHKGHTFRAYDVGKTFQTDFVIHEGQGHQQFLHITGVNGSATVDQALAKFINVSPTVVHVNYIDEETNEEHVVIDSLQTGWDQVLETHSGHQFVAYDEERTFRKIYTMNADGKGMVESHHINIQHEEEL